MALDHARKLMTARLVDSLYTEAMVMADEARGYFDEVGRGDRDLLAPAQRVAFSCESLKVTTRLMHVIAWLLTRKAIAAGEIREDDPGADSRRLGREVDSDAAVIDNLPGPAQAIIRSSMDLYDRVARIDRGLIEPEPESPALGLLRRIERAL
ncbi:DUF1465 family protein [Sphingomonas tabacisoli]|uniref:DUF1465 family protein n=1 Tax=Sphingomonas tabacisoli TaxID=2249466 RepID=A0ABW4I1Y0_9SPHN